jgi:hypothetical protein
MFWPYTYSCDPYRRLEVRLSKTDDRDLRKLLGSGVQQMRVVLRALAPRRWKLESPIAFGP